MGTLFSALDIARAGMLVSQVQLDTAGHNITNVNTEGYSRQRVEVVTRAPVYRNYGAIGRGPRIDEIRRIRDAFLDNIYRVQVGGLGAEEGEAEYFTRIEDIFQEPNEDGFAQRLNVFFDAMNDFANNVEELPARVALAAQAEAVAGSLNEVSNRLRSLRTNANQEVRSITDEINSLSDRIVELNDRIFEFEVTGRVANDLRDDRDLLLDDMARLININMREDESGRVYVYLGGEELIRGTEYRELETYPDSTLDPDRPDLLNVRFADNGQELYLRSGELTAVLEMRDDIIGALEDRMDSIAYEMIRAVNTVHANGRGLQPISTEIETLNLVNSPFSPLNLADLPYPVEDGSFDITVYDSSGAVVETVTVNIVTTGPAVNQTNLGDIEAAINAGLSFLTADVRADERMALIPDAGYSFNISNDTSGALVALGLNGLFTGSTAGDMGVAEYILENPEYISSGYDLDPTVTGDNQAALDMANLRTAEILEVNSQTINEFYESTVVQVGVDSRANLDQLDIERAAVTDFERRRQEVSGVSLDEEVTFLIQYQRAFEGSARIVTVTDRMLDTLLNLIR